MEKLHFQELLEGLSRSLTQQSPRWASLCCFPGNMHNMESNQHLETSAPTEKIDVKGIQMVPKPQRVQLDQAPDLKHP